MQAYLQFSVNVALYFNPCICTLLFHQVNLSSLVKCQTWIPVPIVLSFPQKTILPKYFEYIKRTFEANSCKIISYNLCTVNFLFFHLEQHFPYDFWHVSFYLQTFGLIISSKLSYTKQTTGSGQWVVFHLIVYIFVCQKCRENYRTETSNPVSFSLSLGTRKHVLGLGREESAVKMKD